MAYDCEACSERVCHTNFQSGERADGRDAHFCRDCRPAVKAVRMRLTRAGERVTWTTQQVNLVRAELRARARRDARAAERTAQGPLRRATFPRGAHSEPP